MLKGLVGKRVTVFLTTGKAYHGELKDHDEDTICLGPDRKGGRDSLVYKDQITAISEEAREA